jgi:hypothetical protein
MVKTLTDMLQDVHQGVQDHFNNPDVPSTNSGTTLALAAIGCDFNKKITVYTHTIGDSPVFVAAKKTDGTFVIQQITTDENVPTQPNIITNYINMDGIAHRTEPLSFTEQALRQRLNVDPEAQLMIIAASDGLLDGLDGTVQRPDGFFRFFSQDPQKQYNRMRQGNLNILAAYLTTNRADTHNLARRLLAFALEADPATRRQQSRDNITVIAMPIASVDPGKTAVSIVCDGNSGSAILADLVINLYTEKLELLAPPQNRIHNAVLVQRDIAEAGAFQDQSIIEDDIRAPMKAFEDVVKKYEKTPHDIRQTSVAEIDIFYDQYYDNPYKAIEGLSRNANPKTLVDVAEVLGAMYALKDNLRKQGDTYYAEYYAERIEREIAKLVDPKSLTQDSENVNLTQNPSAFREAAKDTMAYYNEWLTKFMSNAQSLSL